MPKGDPAGYLPNVKKARAAGGYLTRKKRKGEPPLGRHQRSSFNPFGGGGVDAGRRIKRGADNKPNEGDSDWRGNPYKGRKRG